MYHGQYIIYNAMQLTSSIPGHSVVYMKLEQSIDDGFIALAYAIVEWPFIKIHLQ